MHALSIECCINGEDIFFSEACCIGENIAEPLPDGVLIVWESEEIDHHPIVTHTTEVSQILSPIV
jgi:hypothetical protein